MAHALDAQAPSEAARVVERRQDTTFLHGKIEQYSGAIADLEAALRDSGYTRDVSHHALAQQGEVRGGHGKGTRLCVCRGRGWLGLCIVDVQLFARLPTVPRRSREGGAAAVAGGGWPQRGASRRLCALHVRAVYALLASRDIPLRPPYRLPPPRPVQLPPDANLAHVKLEQARRELAALDAQLQRGVDLTAT